MRDLEVLKLLLTREEYDKYRSLLKQDAFAYETGLILQSIDRFNELNNEPIIKLNEFETWFFHCRHPDLTSDQRDIYTEIFHNLDKVKTSDTIIKEFNKQYLDTKLAEAIEESRNIADYIDLINRHSLAIIDNNSIPWNDLSLTEVLKNTDRDKGYKYRLDSLQKHLEGLVLGDFVVVAGRPGQGKTTFLASEVTNIARQLNENDVILWLNNEGMSSHIKIRLYCSFFGKSRDEIFNNKEKAEKGFKENGGDRIKLIDFHSKGKKDILYLINTYNPKLLVVDMLDHIKGFDYKNTNEAGDAKYDRMYQWFREIASTKCPVIGTTQLNVEGENKEYPNLSDLKGSATSKQGGATTIITIGSKNNIGYEYIRFIGTTKNKVGKLPLRHQVKIDMEKCRFEEL